MKPSRCLVLTAAPHGADAVIVTRRWTTLTTKDIKQSISGLGIGVCKAIAILPNVNKQFSLCITLVFPHDYFNQVITNVTTNVSELSKFDT